MFNIFSMTRARVVIVFNATFSNISAISWRPVLVVEEAGVSGEKHRLWARNWQSLSLAVGSRVHPFCNLQRRVWTHDVLVICLYELLIAESAAKHNKSNQINQHLVGFRTFNTIQVVIYCILFIWHYTINDFWWSWHNKLIFT
jgi:hypothetical protein